MYSKKAIQFFRKWVLSLFILITIDSTAQLKNIPIGGNLNIDRLYVGLLANTSLLQGGTNNSSNSSFQLGLRASVWLIPKMIRVRSFGALKFNENRTTNYIKSYEAIFSLLRDMEIAVGVMATPTTELRPNPITWESQVETNAERKIPGGKPGIKISYRLNENLKIAYGIHNQDNSLVQHFKIQYKAFALSSFFKDGKFFLAAKWRYKNNDFIMTRYDGNTALSVSIRISSRYRLYLDMGYDDRLGKFVFGEWGLRRHFPNDKLLTGFFSISYNKNLNQLLGGLFIHI
ncbi:MAG: hypothetical protein AAF039_12440 [Bacteroidota bacterium]